MDTSKLKEKDLPARRPGMSRTDWLLKCLLSRKGSKANRWGVYVVVHGREKMIPFLLDNALNSDLKPRHRVLMLDLMLQIGDPLSADDYSTIAPLVYGDSTEVAEKAHEVLLTLNPKGPPPLLSPHDLKRFCESSRAIAQSLL